MMVVKGKSPALMKVMIELSATKRVTARQARQIAEGIPAEWTRRKSQSYRQFMLRRDPGTPWISPQQWEAGEGRKKRGSKSAAPEGWHPEEWRAYRSTKSERKRHGKPFVTPEQWREEISRYPPDIYKERATWRGRRKERQAAAVARILKIAEQESRRRVA